MSTFEESAAVSTSEAASGGVTRKLVNEMVPFLRDPRPEIRCGGDHHHQRNSIQRPTESRFCAQSCLCPCRTKGSETLFHAVLASLPPHFSTASSTLP